MFNWLSNHAPTPKTISDGNLMRPNLSNTLNRDADAVHWNITSVERDTGISKDTLRMWERRYGFPSPSRDALGERLYPLEQVEKLRAIKRLIDLSFRPGKIIALDTVALRNLAIQNSGLSIAKPVPVDQLVNGLMDLIKTHQIDTFRTELAEHVAKHGVAKTIKEIIAPLTINVGQSWHAGELEVFEEHLFTESVQVVLRNAINTVPKQIKQPKVLLTTLPQEAHGLGLLMAEAIFALEGCATLSLGVQTPMWDIVQAATRQKVDIVALSFSLAMNRQQVQDGLRELRHQLHPSIEIWAGGASAALNRRVADGVLCTQSLDAIVSEVKRWRTLHKLISPS
jgi:MerR family transcriptional regulator, light-induced transcriptional regulator